MHNVTGMMRQCVYYDSMILKLYNNMRKSFLLKFIKTFLKIHNKRNKRYSADNDDVWSKMITILLKMTDGTTVACKSVITDVNETQHWGFQCLGLFLEDQTTVWTRLNCRVKDRIELVNFKIELSF